MTEQADEGRVDDMPIADVLCEQLERLQAENERLRAKILRAAGDDLCRLSQEEIKDMSAGKVKIPPKEEFLASCAIFHAQVAQEEGVLENSRTIAQLEAESEQLLMSVSRLEAEAGAMRSAIMMCIERVGIDHELYADSEGLHNCPEDDTCECQHINALNAALNSSAGQSLLDENKRLREALEKCYELAFAKPDSTREDLIGAIFDIHNVSESAILNKECES